MACDKNVPIVPAPVDVPEMTDKTEEVNLIRSCFSYMFWVLGIFQTHLPKANNKFIYSGGGADK